MRGPFFLLAAIVAGFCACSPEEEIFRDLEDSAIYFSTDTLRFDTVLTGTRSPSYRVMLFNPNKYGVIIPSVGLQGADSPYTITLNGETGRRFTNVKILGKDSLLLLIDVQLPVNNQAAPQLAREYVEIGGAARPFLVMEAWGQDATFYSGLHLITDDTVWDSLAPYVIQDSLLVTENATLTINEGVHVIMRPGSFFFVAGRLITAGSAKKQVVFRNERTDANYKNAPGQWGAIYFLEGSSGNSLNHTVIKNGDIGLRIGTPDDDDVPDVTLSNCVIANMSSDGILAFSSDVYAYNTVVYNSARYLAGHFAGGNYRYEHCTFSNYPNDFFREDPAVLFADNLLLDNEELLVAPLAIQIVNSVVWGTEPEEIEINTEGGTASIFQVRNSLLKTTNSLLQAGDNITDKPPRFFNEFLYDYRPDSLSPLINAGTNRNIELDILGLPRDSLPDIGAYEWREGQKRGD